MSQTDKQKAGAWGEERAALFLADQGYEIVERNFHFKHCELDIIAWHKKYHHGRTLCFIEVKTRADAGDGSAERATGREKLAHLLRAAQAYCLEHQIDIERTPIQFEQVSVYTSCDTHRPQFRHYVIPVE